jgi:hypothetical protein
MLVSFCFNVTLLVFASSVRVKGVVGEDVVLGLRKTTVVCVILAEVRSVEEISVVAAVEETEVVVIRTVVVLGVVVIRTVVVLGVVVTCAVVVIVVVDGRSVVLVV